MTLLGVKLGGEVADVRGLDFVAARSSVASSAPNSRLAHHRHEVLVFFRPIAGEVGLRSAQNVYRRWFLMARSY